MEVEGKASASSASTSAARADEFTMFWDLTQCSRRRGLYMFRTLNYE